MRYSTLGFGVMALALSAAAPAFAGTVFSSADFTNYTSVAGDGSNEPGGVILDTSDFFAASFTLNQSTQITGVGGYFSELSSGNFFGAIVSTSSPSAAPTVTGGNVASQALAYVTFTPTGNDQTVSLSSPIVLGPGSYDLVFGAFGNDSSGFASGGALVTGQSNNQASTALFQYSGGNWLTSANSDVRVDVQGSPVPLPAALPLMLSGLMGLGALVRRQAKP